MSLFVLYGVQSIADRIDCKEPMRFMVSIVFMVVLSLSLFLSLSLSTPLLPFQHDRLLPTDNVSPILLFLGERSFHKKV